MENNVVKYHLVTSVVMKKLFEKIKENENIDFFLIVEYLMILKSLKNKVGTYYREIISSFKDEKVNYIYMHIELYNI